MEATAQTERSSTGDLESVNLYEMAIKSGIYSNRMMYDKIGVLTIDSGPIAISVFDEFYIPLFEAGVVIERDWDCAMLLDDRVQGYSPKFDAVYRIPTLDDWKLIAENIDKIQGIIMRYGGDSLIGKAMWSKSGSTPTNGMFVRFTWRGYDKIATEWKYAPKTEKMIVRRIFELRPNKDTKQNEVL